MWITGDETGLIKLVEDEQTVLAFGEQERSSGIVSLTSQNFQAELDPCFLSLRQNGIVERWEVIRDAEAVSNLLLRKTLDSAITRPLSMHALPPTAESDSAAFVVIGADGQGSLYRSDKQVSTFTMSSPLSASHLLDEKSLVIGGRENDVQIFDLERNECSWKARNVPHDKLNLRVPVWVSALDASPSDPSLLAVGTAHRHLR
eukprot:gene45145-55223_t